MTQRHHLGKRWRKSVWPSQMYFKKRRGKLVCCQAPVNANQQHPQKCNFIGNLNEEAAKPLMIPIAHGEGRYLRLMMC
jgi:phosphoribosylformylglycinamidine (FGAM) synthase-like amidotransferase family enzyme